MECPKCGHVQADGPPECAKCGLLFAKWVERRSVAPTAPRQAPPSPAGAPPGSEVSPLALLLGSTAVLFLGLSAWHLWVGSGLPVDHEAYRDRDAGYAVALPSGWSLLTSANAAVMLENAPGRYPEAVEHAVRSGRALAVFFLPSDPGALAPWGTVTAVEGIPPPLMEKDEDSLSAAAATALAARYGGYRSGGASVREVDRLAALKVTGGDEVRFLKSPSQEVYGELPGGSRYPIGRTEDIWDTFDRSLEHWLVPGSGRTFILAFGCPEESRAAHAAAFRHIVDSFRVTDRPLRYGPVATPALRAAVMVLLAAVLLYTLTEAAALRRR